MLATTRRLRRARDLEGQFGIELVDLAQNRTRGLGEMSWRVPIIDNMRSAIRWAPKLSIALIARLYSAAADGREDDALIDDVGWKLVARCEDVLRVSDSRVVCPTCREVFGVAWISQPDDSPAACPKCGWMVSAGEYHASFEHRDLFGINARNAFADFVARFPSQSTFSDKMRVIDALVHAVHTRGGPAARNLFEGRARQVIAELDRIAGR